MEEILCPDEAFGMNIYGDEEIVKNIIPNELYERYNNILNNSYTIILISGNLSGYENLESEVREVFGDKLNNERKLDKFTYNKFLDIKNAEIEEIKEIQDTAQSVLSIGMKIKDYNPSEYFSLNVYNTILGSTPSSKLFQNVREKASLAYTVRSRYYRFKPVIVIYAGIQLENYDKAKKLILEQVEDMKKGKISDIEFESAKESLLADLLEWSDSKLAISKMKLSNIVAFGNDEMTIEQMRNNVRNVTLDDVITVAQKIEPAKIFLLGGETNV